MTGFTYAIGDIHGRLDLLRLAIRAILADGKGEHHRIVTLGDYVDRGPDSRGVVDFLMAKGERLRIVSLKGNHEAMMVDAIRSGSTGALSHWLFHGGEATLRSYGWTGRRGPEASLVPPDHLDWLDTRPLMLCDDRRVFVHAGLHPDRALHEQDEKTCLWIRDRFLDAAQGQHGLHVVHGHTPEWKRKTDAARTERLAHRTNLDTGAYYTDRLSIGVFADDTAGGPVKVLQVTASGDAASAPDDARAIAVGAPR